MVPRRNRLTLDRRARRRAMLHTVEFLALVVLLSVWAYVGLTRPLVGPGAMSGGIAFLLVQLLFVPTVVGYVVARKVGRGRAGRRRQRHLPEVRTALAAFAAGGDFLELQRLFGRYSDLVESALLDFLPAVAGGQRRRLTNLADRLQLLPRWTRSLAEGTAAERRGAVGALATVATTSALAALRSAMDDELASVRADAYRAILVAGTDADVVAVASRALGESLLTRAMLADDFKRHAPVLTGEVIPHLLAEGEDTALRRALDLLASWRVLVPFDAIREVLGHRDPTIVARGLEILPFTAARDELAETVVRRLQDPAARVRRAAAFCAGRMRLRAAAPFLAELLYEPRRDVARAGAGALARLGAEGRSFLDAAVIARDRRGAGLALEALEHGRVAPRLAVGE